MCIISNFKGNQVFFSVTTVPSPKPQIKQLSCMFQYWNFYLPANLISALIQNVNKLKKNPGLHLGE